MPHGLVLLLDTRFIKGGDIQVEVEMKRTGADQFMSFIFGLLCWLFGMTGALVGAVGMYYAIAGAHFDKMPEALIFIAGGIGLVFAGRHLLKEAEEIAKVLEEESKLNKIADAQRKLIVDTVARTIAVEREQKRESTAEKLICKSCGQEHPTEYKGVALVSRCSSCGSFNSLVKTDTPLGKKIAKEWGE